MRQGQQNRRGRGRGNNPNNNNNSNHRKGGQNPLTRSYESNGPDIKIRGSAAHVAEKYMTLARDAHSSGDSVMAESYLQHAEHYNRLIMAFREQQQQTHAADGMNGNGAVNARLPGSEAEGNEDGEEDDGEMSDPLSFGRFDSLPEQPMPQSQPAQPAEFRQQRHDRQDRQGYRQERPQHDRDRQHDRPQNDRQHDRQDRQDRPQHDRQDRQHMPRRDYRDNQRPFDGPRNEQPRNDGPRNDAPRFEAPRNDMPREIGPRDTAPRVEVIEPVAEPVVQQPRGYEPRRRQRPPLAPAAVAQPASEPGEGFSEQPEFLTRPVRRRVRDREPVETGEGGIKEANGASEPNDSDKSTV